MLIKAVVIPVGNEKAFPHRTESQQSIMFTCAVSAAVKTILLGLFAGGLGYNYDTSPLTDSNLK